MDIKIYKFELQDLESIKDSLALDFDDFWGYDILIDELQSTSSRYIIAKNHDNEIVGFAGIKIIIDEADIMNIVVKKNYRHKGIGNLLLEYLISLCDELHFGNEDSEAREQMKIRGNLVRVPDGIYYRDNANEDFKPLEKNPDCSYRVLDNNTYWRDVKSDGLRFYHHGADLYSVLVSKNPVTGEFEDINLDVNRAHGDFLEGKIFDEEDKAFKTAMYKRNYKNGKFELDAKFPFAECSYCDGRKPSRIFISFKTDDGTCYIYGADKKHSSLVKIQGEHKVKINRFTNEPLDNSKKTHKQKTFKNLADLMKAKGGNGK